MAFMLRFRNENIKPHKFAYLMEDKERLRWLRYWARRSNVRRAKRARELERRRKQS